MYDIFYIQLIFGCILLGGLFTKYILRKKNEQTTTVKSDITLVIISVLSLIVLDIIIYMLRIQ